MPSLSEYEAQHLQNIAKLSGNIKALYFRYIEKIFQKTTGLKLAEGQTYNLDRYPAFKRQFDELLKQMSADMQGSIVNGIKQEWQLANSKNDDWLDMVIKDRTLPDALKDRFFDKNIPAMNQFLARKEAGFTLSDRVWHKELQFSQEVEATLQDGIFSGKSAARMATELKVNLKNPDLIFRRVRDAQGKLQLSKRAMEYNPGQGRYWSSYQNALRLSASEVNMSYRSSDHERWKRINFVLGFEVKLSNRHKIEDICDFLKGRYPKEFKFRAWHPRCLCFAVPIRPSEDAMGEYFDSIMAGEDPDSFQFSGQVENTPKGLTDWMSENNDRVAGLKNKPIFVKDNPQFITIKKPG
jgi:hypothetical protein